MKHQTADLLLRELKIIKRDESKALGNGGLRSWGDLVHLAPTVIRAARYASPFYLP
jgi:hypothetical protein